MRKGDISMIKYMFINICNLILLGYNIFCIYIYCINLLSDKELLRII